MQSSLRHLQPLHRFPKTLPAAQYNRIRLATLREPIPLRLELPDLRVVDAILQQEAWLCVDVSARDQPLLGWSDFEVGRSGPQAPVGCTLYVFHYHAGLIMGPALDALYEATAPGVREKSEIIRLPFER